MDIARNIGGHVPYRYRPGQGQTTVFAIFLGPDQKSWDDVIDVLPRGNVTLRFHAASGNLEDVPTHFCANTRTLATACHISEAFVRVANCGVVRKANLALERAKQTLAEIEKND